MIGTHLEYKAEDDVRTVSCSSNVHRSISVNYVRFTVFHY
jgi:hypothetical protein